jgi:cholesterol oxidase
VLEVLAEDGITVMAGAGVGGGSLVYSGVLVQPPRELFEQVFPRSIDYREMDRVYYPRVREMLKPAPIPEDLLGTDYYATGRVLRENGVRAGFPPRERSAHFGNGTWKMDLSVDWDVIRGEMAGTRVASAITGQQWYGNNSGAKLSLDRNYLPRAEATGRVEIRPLHVVTEVAAVPAGGYTVACDVIDETGEVARKQRLRCEYLFLAAGSMGTSKMLVRAKGRGTLPGLNEFAGQGWGNNGDIYVMRGNLAEVTNPHLGGPGAGCAVLNYENPVAPCIMMPFPPPRLGAAVPGKNAIFSGVVVQTPARGRFAYDAAADSVRLSFPSDPVSLQAARHLAEHLCKVNGGEVLQLDAGVSAHPLGGACLGQVCDDCGRVEGHPNLYVVDGALMPGSTTCVNPVLTIAAVAERCLDRILAGDMSRGQ